MAQDSKSIAIVGAGLAGLAMALSLDKLGISCTVYEQRDDLSAARTEGGGMMVGANALRILDYFGVYEKILPRGYTFDYVNYKNDNEETVDRFPFGNKENFGYSGLRLYRQGFLETMYAQCKEQGVKFEFGVKFKRVVEETADGVTFELGDGTTRTTQLLIGADGIHSKIRDSYITDGTVKKEYTGMSAITYELDATKLAVPADKNYVFPVQLTTKTGSFVIAPQTPDGSLMLAGTQFRLEEKSREEWAAFLNDKDTLCGMLRQNYDKWPSVIQSALDNINTDTFNVWAFYKIPTLERWMSTTHRRVVLVGDAAHALPPTTGLGASMAFEDVYALSLLIKKLQEEPRLAWANALQFWQTIRQRRIDGLVVLTKQLNNKRLPTDKQAEIVAQLGPQEIWADRSEEDPDQMAWLYKYSAEKEIEAWASEVLGKAK